MSGEAAAWTALTRGLETLAERVQADDFPADEAGRAETFRHLAQQSALLARLVDRLRRCRRPWFQRQNDLVTPGAGRTPTTCTATLGSIPATSTGSGRFMNSSEDFALAIRTGFRHTDRPATLTELTASDLGIGRGDEFEILLGGAGDEPNRLPIGDGAVMCSIREYYFDWAPVEPATFTIERIDDAPAGPRAVGRRGPRRSARSHRTLDGVLERLHA